MNQAIIDEYFSIMQNLGWSKERLKADGRDYVSIFGRPRPETERLLEIQRDHMADLLEARVRL